MTSCGENFTFTWKIENFSCLPHQTGERLTSPEFIVESIMKSKWCLWLYPRGYSDDPDEGKDHLSLFLCNLEKSPLTVYWCILLETKDTALQVPNWKDHKASPIDNGGKGVFKIIPLSRLYEKKRLYLPQDVLTVKCWVSSIAENYKLPIYTKPSIVPGLFQKQCCAITRTSVQKKSLTWPIKKIGKHLKNKETSYVNLNGALNSTPSLKLTFSISEDSNEEYAQIEILVTECSVVEKRLFVKCKIAIITADKIYQHSVEDTHLFSLKHDDTWVIPFIEVNNLTDGKCLYLYDTLVLQCDFAFCWADKEYHLELPQYAPWCLDGKHTLTNKLGSDICRLYTNGDLCDISLQADGKTFPTHKLVLCARSPVFNAMFENDMKEKSSNFVDITDVDAKTLERFLRFLYSDIVDEELTFDEAYNLYEAADEYQVDRLKQQCSILLLSTLSVSNVCHVIILADAHQDHFLMSVVYNFLQYHSTETFNSKEWKNFMELDPKLSGLVMFKVWQRKSFL